MLHPNITVIAFEGLHNSGKSTQIEMLSSGLQQRGIHTVVLRGHGFRTGVGEGISDSVSVWWQRNHALFVDAGRKGGEIFMQSEAKATDKLYREFFDVKKDLIQKLKKRKIDKAVILLDRSIISRLFVWLGHSRTPNYKNLLSFSYGKSRKEKMSLPDVVIVLKVPQKTLLARNVSKAEEKNKLLLNKEIILNRYNDYNKLINNIPKDIQARTVIINAGRSKAAVQNDIIKIIINRLHLIQ